MPTRRKPTLGVFTARVPRGTVVWLDGLADKYRVYRSDVHRHALNVAAKHEEEVIAKIEEDQ